MNTKRILCFFIALIVATTIFPMFSFAESSYELFNEACGNGLVCSLKDGKLTISGVGPMDDFCDTHSPRWDYNYRKVYDVVIEEGATRIGSEAFQAHKLNSVSIPDTVTSIGYSAFKSINSELFIPKNLIEISDTAFGWVNRFKVDPDNPNYSSDENGFLFNKDKTVLIKAANDFSGDYVIPDSVVEIRDNAFKSCGISSISFPEGLETIGENAFAFCDDLYLENYDNALYIGDSKNPYRILYLATNTYIEACTIHEDTEFIYSQAFSDCKKLKSVIIPEGVKEIGVGAFERCQAVTSLSLPNSLITIADKAFIRCYSIPEILIPSNVKSIGNSAFAYCDSAVTVSISDSVTSIGDYAFQDINASEISLSEGLTHAGLNVFEDCRYLVYNEYNGVYYLGNSNNPYIYLAKAKDETITEHTVPDETKIIANEAFKDHKELETVNLGDGLIEIGEKAFYNCSSLSNLNFGNNLKRIFREAFGFCNVTNISLQNSVTYLGYSVFRGCDNLKTVDVPEGVVEIYSSFQYCTGLEYINVDENNPEYSSDDRGVLFNKDKTLLIQAPGNISGSYTVPSTVKTIDDYAFEYCQSLTEIIIPDNVTNAGKLAFMGCSNLKNVEIGSGLKGISEQMFQGCRSLTGLTLPKGLTTILPSAFYGCSSLSWLFIPDSVIYIGYSEFENCYNMWHVLFEGTEEQWKSSLSGHYHKNLERATIHYNANNDEIIDAENKLCVLCCTHDYVQGQTVDPDCENDGYSSKKCNICGHELKSDIVPASGHQYDNDCDPDCNICGKTRSIEHKPGKDATATEDQICTVCGAVLNPATGGNITAVLIIAGAAVISLGGGAAWFIFKFLLIK